MLGTFQHTTLRLEFPASEATLRDSLLRPDQFRQWLWPQQFDAGLPARLTPGLKFSSQAGPIKIQHQVVIATDQNLRIILSGGVDGFQDWHWGEGWLQSRLEGYSVLPLTLSHSLTLIRLRQYLSQKQATDHTAA